MVKRLRSGSSSLSVVFYNYNTVCDIWTTADVIYITGMRFVGIEREEPLSFIFYVSWVRFYNSISVGGCGVLYIYLAYMYIYFDLGELFVYILDLIKVAPSLNGCVGMRATWIVFLESLSRRERHSIKCPEAIWWLLVSHSIHLMRTPDTSTIRSSKKECTPR